MAVTMENVTDDPFLIILNITNNISALNWSIHAYKKSALGRRLARLFCRLLIRSPLGINSKWISTHENTIADAISRMKKESCSDNAKHFPSFNYSSLKQKFKELQVCHSFVPESKLLSTI